MGFMSLKVERLSLCGCGYRFLKDHIPLGAEYHVYPDSAQPGWLVCGKCGKRHAITLIHAINEKGFSGFVALEIFYPEFPK